jgi:hypothetical protein
MLANRSIIDPTRGEPPREPRGLPSRPIRLGWLSILILALLIAWPCCLRAAGASDEAPEYELKAAFLYKFAQYVTWPSNAFENAEAPLIIGILGDDPSKGLLGKNLIGKTVNGRKLMIKLLTSGDSLAGCHLLFISPSEKESLSNILPKLQGRSILTVSEYAQFAQRGGMINLFLDDQKRVRFQINAGAAKKGGLMISSKLGGLGIPVKTDEAPGNQ